MWTLLHSHVKRKGLQVLREVFRRHPPAKLPTPIDLAEVGGLNPLVVAPS